MNSKLVDVECEALVIWFPEPSQIDKFSFVTADNSPNLDPKQWVVEGSIDGTSWKLLHTQNIDYAGERLKQTDWFSLELVRGEQAQQTSLMKGDAVAWGSTFGVIHTSVRTVSNHWIRVAF